MNISNNNTSSPGFLKIVNAILFFVILLLLLFIGLSCFKNIYPEGDVMEHIYSTFLVSTGKVPYRDFFEHHHPLLWYIFAPFIGILYRNVEVIGWADYVTFCFFVVGLYFFYRMIEEFLSIKTAALLSLIYVLLPNIFLYYVYYKPDNWMLSCICIGIYYFFGYLRDCKRYQLILSYLFLFTAFLFIQKALFFYPIIGVVSLYALYKKEMPIKDFLCALLLPVLIFIAAMLYFYFVGGLKEYFYFNFVFNKEMLQYFGEGKICQPFETGKIIIWAGLLASVVLYKYESRYFRILSWIFWIICAHKAFCFSPHVYYWYEPYYFGMPLVAVAVMRLSEKQKLLLILVFIETLIYAGFMGYYLYHDLRHKPKYNAPEIHEIVLNNSNPCDEFIGFGGESLLLFTTTPQYYRIILGEIDVFGERIGLHGIEDLNALIEQRKPKMIYVNTVYERYSSDSKNKRIIHKPNMEMIEKYYEPTEYASDEDGLDTELMDFKKLDYKKGLWMLKSEYRKNRCLWDEKDKRWKYVEN